ncbi:MAG TPA: non-ribosomal peptide synthetase, partial [Gordonia polyisoprenivorans]|nr:non-ribosomal peptide synthetase [Gordonia polyisoprenivorans]
IFTSGSTGTPKGVSVSRDNLATMLGATLDAVGAGPTDVWSWAHSYAFDFSVWEIFGALASGGRIAVLDRTTVRDPRLLLDALATHGVTILSQTPTAFARLTDPEIVGADGDLPALRTVVFGGEALHPTALHDWAATHSGTRLINMYGITETTVHLTAADVDTTDARSIIGTPFAGVGWSVRDRHLRPVPVGGLGELYASGAQLADGYLHAPALTANRFVADPDGCGARMYRTGDVVRLIAPDRLVYLGRSDDQMQVRGHRVEPAEIAAALVEAPGVREARVVIAGGTQPGDEQILAFVIDDDTTADDTIGSGVSAEEREALLQRACATRLPGYLMPTRIGVVERWPLTDNGKLDRHALIAGLPAVTGTPAPLTAAQRRIADLVAEIVGHPGPQAAGRATNEGGPERWGPDVNFFSVGGNSLSAARLAARLSGPGTQVTVADILAAPTIRGLTELVAADTHTPQVRSRDVLWPAQRVLWDAHRGQPDSAAYHLALRLTVRAEVPVVRAALLDLADRHPMLRAVFPDRGDATPEIVVLHADALTGNPPITQRDTVPDAGQVAEIVNAPFDLTTRPAWRAVLADSPAGTGIVLVAHHIAVDGTSLPILVTDFLTAVDARRDGQAPSWLSAAAQFSASITADPTDTAAAQTFWSTHLDGAPDHSALPEPARPGPVSYHHRHLDTTSRERLAQTAAAAGGTVAALLRVTLAAVLARITGLDDVVLSVPTSGRATTADLGRVGMFVRTLPLRHTATLDQRLGEALTRTDATLAEAVRHADAAPAGLADVLLTTAVTLPDVTDTTGTLIRTVRPLDTGFAQTALQFAITDTTDGIDIRMTVDGHRVDPAGAALILDDFVEAVTQLAGATADTVIGQQLPPSAAPAPAPRRTPTLDPIRALIPHTRSTPHAIAVTDARGDLTYSQLAARARTLAITLLRTGVRDGDRVALQMSRSSDTIIAMVAVLMAGAAYVPIDPDLPQSRLDELLDAATPVAIIGDGLHVDTRGPSTSARVADRTSSSPPA